MSGGEAKLVFQPGSLLAALIPVLILVVPWVPFGTRAELTVNSIAEVGLGPFRLRTGW